MSPIVITVAVVAAFCFGTIHSASIGDSSECPIAQVVANWNTTVEDCVKQSVAQGDVQTVAIVTEMIHLWFHENNKTDATQSKEGISDTAILNTFEAYFCVMTSVVKQSPKLALMAYECTKTISSNVTDNCEIQRDISSCFVSQLKKSCSFMADSRKKRSLVNAINGI